MKCRSYAKIGIKRINNQEKGTSMIKALSVLLSLALWNACTNGGKVSDGNKATADNGKAIASNTSQDGSSSTGEDDPSEPVSVGGAYLACISPNAASSTVDIYCGLKKKTDHTLVTLPAKAQVNAATLFGTDGGTIPLVALASPDPKWHWLFSQVRVKLSDGALLVMEINSSGQTSGAIRAYFADPTKIGAQETSEIPAVASGVPVTYFAWRTGEPNDYQGRDESCVCVRDYNYQTAPSDWWWNDFPCNVVTQFACENPQDASDWVISAGVGQWSDSAGKCPAGYQFSVPHNVRESILVATLADQAVPNQGAERLVWFNVRRAAPHVDYWIMPK